MPHPPPRRKLSTHNKPSTVIPIPPPTMHVRLSADIWMDVFLDHYSYLLNDEECTIPEAVDKAHNRADAALEAYERRWPNVKLLP